jgi:hypothetical protein
MVRPYLHSLCVRLAASAFGCLCCIICAGERENGESTMEFLFIVNFAILADFFCVS